MTSRIPLNLRLGHNVCFALHDAIARHVIEGEETGLKSFEVSLLNANHGELLNALDGEDVWNWSRANGYEDLLEEFSYRQLVFALTSDMCQYLFEALKASAKGKLSVAFTLFRKPVQDHLLYLEFLLGDRKAFLSKFKSGAAALDLSRIDAGLRQSIIARAMQATEVGQCIDPGWMCEVRYDKSSHFGFDPLFNQAVHLVTTHRNYTTETEDINYIFSDDDVRSDLWMTLYQWLPSVLMHALQVVRTLFNNLSIDKPVLRSEDLYWLQSGFLYWKCRIGGDRRIAPTPVMLPKDIACTRCRARFVLDQKMHRWFWKFGDLLCLNCGHSHHLLDAKHAT